MEQRRDLLNTQPLFGWHAAALCCLCTEDAGRRRSGNPSDRLRTGRTGAEGPASGAPWPTHSARGWVAHRSVPRASSRMRQRVGQQPFRSQTADMLAGARSTRRFGHGKNTTEHARATKKRLGAPVAGKRPLAACGDLRKRQQQQQRKRQSLAPRRPAAPRRRTASPLRPRTASRRPAPQREQLLLPHDVQCSIWISRRRKPSGSLVGFPDRQAGHSRAYSLSPQHLPACSRPPHRTKRGGSVLGSPPVSSRL